MSVSGVDLEWDETVHIINFYSTVCLFMQHRFSQGFPTSSSNLKSRAWVKWISHHLSGNKKVNWFLEKKVSDSRLFAFLLRSNRQIPAHQNNLYIVLFWWEYKSRIISYSIKVPRKIAVVSSFRIYGMKKLMKTSRRMDAEEALVGKGHRYCRKKIIFLFKWIKRTQNNLTLNSLFL